MYQVHVDSLIQTEEAEIGRQSKNDYVSWWITSVRLQHAHSDTVGAQEFGKLEEPATGCSQFHFDLFLYVHFEPLQRAGAPETGL